MMGYEGALFPRSPEEAALYLRAAEQVSDQGIIVELFPADEAGREAAINWVAAANRAIDEEGTRHGYVDYMDVPGSAAIARPITVYPEVAYLSTAAHLVDQTLRGGGQVLKIVAQDTTSPLLDAFRVLKQER
jgi:hypothetical protein